jgi:hypothetical protein
MSNYILHSDYHIIATYKSLRGAKTGFTRKWEWCYPDAVIVSTEEFYKSEPTVIVKNLMSGLSCEIKKSLRGGCCDPSTETYWSM